jgi:hypothetical protein
MVGPAANREVCGTGGADAWFGSVRSEVQILSPRPKTSGMLFGGIPEVCGSHYVVYCLYHSPQGWFAPPEKKKAFSNYQY